MLSCFRHFRKPKTAAKQDLRTTKDHEAKQEVQTAGPSHSLASEESRDKSTGNSAVKSNRQRRNLWQEAFAKLDDRQRDLLSKIEESQGPIVVQTVADETEKRYREFHKGRGKMSQDKDKNDINLRAAAEKILSSVLRSKKLIDAGVAFDPTGHAASAWTIISLGLQIVQNDIDRVQAGLEASGLLTDTLARCAAIEACYRDKVLPDSDHLEDTIVEVYMSILEFSAETVRQNEMKIVRRVLMSINSLAGPPLQEFKTKLKAKEEDLGKWNQVIENQYRKQEMEQIYQTTASSLDKLDQVLQKLLSTEDQNILKWLSEYDFSASHNHAVLQMERSTGEWIFDNPHYKMWKKSDCSLLWLYGSSGSGKTILCSNIIDDLQKLCAKDASYALAYWYFSDNSQNSLDLKNLLCSMIRQLCACTQTLPDKIRELWKVYHHSGGRPTRLSVEEALDVLIVGLAAANQTAFIVLDALDECPLSSEHKFSGVQQISERKDALLWLRRFTAKHENLHVMVLSRDENDIRASFDKALQVDVALGVVDDLQLFISNCINRIVEEHGWKDEYIAAMSSRVEGISEKRFRWASLMQRKFSRCLNHQMMQQALEALPESLEDMYADVLTNQIPKECRREARSMLIWLAYSMRPVRLQELATLADVPTPMDVRRICTSSLITFSRETLRPPKEPVGATWRQQPSRESEEDTIVKFDHFSVKEYLLSEDLLASSRDSVSYFYVPPLLAHLTIAEMSVSHLLKTNDSHFTKDDIHVERVSNKWMEYDCEDGWVESSDTQKVLAPEFWPKFPLLEYSTFWHNHVWEADAIEARLAPIDAAKPSPSELKADTESTLSQAETLRAQIHRLFTNAFSQSFANWILLLSLFTNDIPYSFDQDLTAFKGSGVPSPMWLASFFNLPDSVRRVLQSEMISGGRKDFVCFLNRQPDWERTPIQIATRYGHLKVLNLLLEADMHMEQSEFTQLVPDIERNVIAVLSTILEARPSLSITERIVKKTGVKTRATIYTFILNSPDRVHLSETMFAHIVSNFYRTSDAPILEAALVETMLRRGEDVGYSRGGMIETSVQSETSERNTELGIDGGERLSINRDVLALMAANTNCGKDMLAIVLDNYRNVQVSQDLLASIVGNTYDGAGMLANLRKHGKDIRFGQDLLPLIVANRKGGTEMLAGVFKRCKSIPISQDLLVAAGKHGGSDGGKLWDLILGYDENIEVSEDALRAVVKNEIDGAAMVSAIFAHRKAIKFSEENLNAVARNEKTGAKIFSDILSHGIDVAFSEETLKAAASNYWVGIEIFWTILSHNKSIVISTEVMGAIKQLGNEREGSWDKWGKDMHIMNLLMDHGNCEITEEKMSCKSGREQHYEECKIRISRKMRLAAIRWEPDAIDFLEAHKRPNVTFIKSPPREVSEDTDS